MASALAIETWGIQGGGFHFGRQGLGQEITAVSFPSDGLFAAIIDRLAHFRGPTAVEAFMVPFLAGDPPFIISSTFPFAGKVRFFPAPLAALPPGDDPGGTVAPKDLKRVQFLSEALFRRFLAGEALSHLAAGARHLQAGQLWYSPEEEAGLPADIKSGQSPLWAIERRPRVTVGRRSPASTIYFTGRLLFQRQSGLWFGLKWLHPDEGLAQLLAELFTELGTVGLGAERSAGFGACQIENTGSLELAGQPGKTWLTLSRYLPQPDELAALHHPAAAYRLEHVGGWLDSPARRGQRRRPLNLLAEGSIIGPAPRDVPGRIVDVRPRYPADLDPVGHPVYRSGLAFPVALEGGQL